MLVMCNNVLNLLCNVMYSLMMRMMMCILENNDNDLCFVNLLFCQVSI